MNDCVKFKVNGVEHTVRGEVSSYDMLLDYLRNYLQLRGTKYMCREGGCGSCMVTAAKTSGSAQIAINSCLVSVASCHGWDITTIEGLGNRKDGYHTLQTTLANNNGTQCGYCSPGWVMAMHGLLETNPNRTMLEIEQSFGSNLCRCTGYRPILTAFKKFATDAPTVDRIMNINKLNICNPNGKCCTESGCNSDDNWCMISEDDLQTSCMKTITLKDGKIWYRPTALTEVLKLLTIHSESYMLVGGNTAKGVSPIDEYPNALIDISSVAELKTTNLDQNLVVGAGLTLTEFMDILKTTATQDYFSYLSKLYNHVDLVAHIPVRNVGTIAGNLMIKHTSNTFQSDIYLLLNTVGAQLTIVDCNGTETIVTMENFLKMSMTRKVILNVLLPPLNSDEYKFITYKIMPRSQSSHAIVNAGFLYKVNQTTNLVEKASIVYGALSVNFERATATETYLIGKSLFTNDTLQGALKVLEGEMIVDANPPEPSVTFRRYLAKALFFKGLLTLCPSATRASRSESGIINIHESRQCSSSKQSYTTDSSLWPLNQPINKIEAKIQCAGEAQYTEDIPSFHNEVYGAFVLSTVPKGTIVSIDAANALKLDGVIAFYTAKDIPGLNSFTPTDGAFTTVNEEVLCVDTVKHYAQPLGIIVAETQHLANRAAKLVTVEYSNVTTPIIDITEAKTDSSRNTLYTSVDATSTGTDVYKVISGSVVLHGQYHSPMETILCVTIPTEEGLEVHLPSQWLDGPHVMISRALNIDKNKIDVYVRRIGGSYGLKITRSIQAAVACSLVTQKLNCPCRFIQPLTTNLNAIGKRMPSVTDYEVAVNSSGTIQYVNVTSYTDNGHIVNEAVVAYASDVYYNAYDATKFKYAAYNTITDNPKNTFCRSPGTLEAIAGAEFILERISYELSLDPIDVRLGNLDTTNYGDLVEMVETLKTSAEYTTRRAAVDSYNTQNRWKKRGLRWAFCRWPPVGSMYMDINMTIFQPDGSIIINHGGVEMGQGINTKIAQTAAYLLKVSVDKIRINGNNTIITPNASVTGGSITTDNLIIALKKCIEELQTRLQPVKETLTNPTWEQLITAAYAANVDLQCHGFVCASDALSYNIYGIALAEVEVDIMTGEHEVLRVDILQDVGLSISPEVDIGQVEGAFIMGLGYWTCEHLSYDAETGAILTDRTWGYHLPEARDIPQDFRVSFKNNSYSYDVILGSKGVGEPAACLSVVIAFAIREAIVQARQETGIPTTEWFDIDGPYSPEKICTAIGTNTEDFKFS